MALTIDRTLLDCTCHLYHTALKALQLAFKIWQNDVTILI
jgi:hypothetical protein